MSETRDSAPRMAFLIPAFNEGRTINKAIFSLYRAGARPADVYVADDGSTDQTAEIADIMNAQVVTVPNGGKAAAIRRAALHFSLCDRYEWVAIVDADVIVDVCYLVELRRAIRRDPTVALFSGCERAQLHNWLTAWRAVEFAVFNGVYREAQDLARAMIVAPGLCSVWRADVFQTLEFGNGTLTEDIDWTIQMHRRGERVRFVPDAIVHSQNPRTLGAYWRQIQRWHRATWQNVHLHEIGSHAQPIDAVFGGIVIEALVYAVAVALLPVIAWSWGVSYVGWGVVIDQTILLTYTLLVAMRERRMDVIAAFPLFSIPRVLNIVSFARAFLLERRAERKVWTTWISPGRY